MQFLVSNEILIPLQYAVFGKLTKGDETLKKMEELPTRKEGMFVMVSCSGFVICYI